MGKFADIFKRRVVPSEAPSYNEPGTIRIVTPGGKIEVSARISSSADARDVRKVLDVLLSKAEENFDFEEFIGKTE